MVAVEQLERGRQAYERRAWADAYDLLATADQDASLEPDDLERLGITAYLTGNDEATVEFLERSHHGYLQRGETARSVRCAFWIGMFLAQRAQHAQAGGWLSRAQRLVGETSLRSVEQGYLLIPTGLQALGGDPATAYATFGQAAKIADEFNDADLVALGRLGRGQALVAMGEVHQGVAMLDEAMVGVTTGDVSPVAAGIVYCAVIIACRDIFDLRRAQEWTTALSRWCAAQQGLKPYRGQCLVHRSEIMQLKGEWADAIDEVRQACEHLSDSPGHPVMGMARYQQAELLRLRGDLAEAERMYREASGWGHPTQPGMALLRLAQGRVGDARVAIRQVVTETAERPVERSRVLAAYVEIALADGDLDTARSGVHELGEIADEFGSPYLRAMAGYVLGAVLLAEGGAASACATLRRAWAAWQELDAPYEAARVRVLIARACRELRDNDTAEMELDAAGRAFEQLGAALDLAVVTKLSRSRGTPREAGGLSTREVEVLRLVATGATNREIADVLVISEKTVARHVSNILAKLDLSSRTAAAAYAYEHHLM